MAHGFNLASTIDKHDSDDVDANEVKGDDQNANIYEDRSNSEEKNENSIVG
jgi:hypothetical protein